MTNQISVILHGGAGRYDAENAPLKIPVLKEALDAAWASLCRGESSEQAVIAGISVLEGSEYFNAGYGGYPNNRGVVLLDVGLMKGTREFISLMNVRRVKYPSRIALEMFKYHSSLMTIWTHELMQQLDEGPQELKDRYGWVASNEEMVAPFVKNLIKRRTTEVSGDENHGTVGCVARDQNGTLAAGTSTGGINLKLNGRVGDSPIIAGGVFADNEICALSTTGHGEAFMSSMVSGFVIAEMRRQLRNDPEVFTHDPEILRQLLKAEFKEFDRKSRGRGGALIVIPVKGVPAYTFNSEMASLAARTGTPDSIHHEEIMIAHKGGKHVVAGVS